MITSQTHPKNIGVYKSNCCIAQVTFFPPCFGDPGEWICNHCKKFCEVTLLPEYYEVSKGTWRKINYEKNEKI